MDDRRRSVRRQRLGCRAEVEEGARGEPDGASAPVDGDGAPPRRGSLRREFAVNPANDVGEIAVVAQAIHGCTDGRIDQPTGRVGHGERHVDRLEEITTDHDLRTRGGVEPAQLRVAPEAAGHKVDALELPLEQFRCREECVIVRDDLCDRAEGVGPVNVLAVDGGVGLGHQVDPLVTGGGAEAACGAVDGGLREFEELGAPAPWLLLPTGTVAVVVAELAPLWCPGRALAT